MAVVAAVARVVRDHRPPREDVGREQEDCQRVERQCHRGNAEQAATVAPSAELFEMLEIGLALRGGEPPAELSHVGAKCL